MRINGNGPMPASATNTAAETAAIDASTRQPTASSTAATGALQSAVLAPALAALRDMPDIDHAKVATLRDALARGAVPFDAAKLAGLIERFHVRTPGPTP